MTTSNATAERLDALRTLTLAEVEARICELDAERVALSLLRRSLAARDATLRRQTLRRQNAAGRVENA